MKLTRTVEKLYERIRWGGYYRPAGPDVGRDIHLQEAAAWLCRAQDAGSDRGFSYGVRFGHGYEASYPETTGYIIPTMLSLEKHYGDAGYRTRAVEAADWEVAIQMDSGAVMGGKYSTSPSPAVFNTGQVLIGWAAIGEATGQNRYREAARRACTWMLENQERDGRWVRGNSRFADPEITVYNVKAAWGMCLAGALWGWDDAVQGAVRSAEYALANQRPNGWFARCCLSDAERPLLHTLAYTAQGLVGIGDLTGRQDFIAGAQRIADALASRLGPDGFLPGRFTEDWTGAVEWCCLTGNVQMSWVWARLFEHTRDERYRKACTLANDYVMAHHDVSNPDVRVRGGVPGSWPTWGDYGRLKILNWATKFFVDALLCEKRIAAAGSHA
jgi:hypothetical protein